MLSDTAIDRVRIEANGCATVTDVRRPRPGRVPYFYPIVGQGTLAHRAFYEEFVGPIPQGFVVHHECGNRLCVRPDHLRAMTQREHMSVVHTHLADGKSAKTHCPQGHPYEGENLMICKRSDGGPARRCRICDRATKAASDRRRRPWRYKAAA